ncbi:MAG: hypothetical protein RR646_01400 [Erysipelotrichaceae bacterium]
MKRYSIVLLLLAIVLSGCTPQITFSNINQDTINNINAQVELAPTNSTKKYYSYYLPTDVGRIKSTDLSEMLVKNNNNIIMNFETSNLIIEQYYTNKDDDKDKKTVKDADKDKKQVETTTDKTDSDEKVFKGTYKNNNDEELAYKIIIKKCENERYFIYFDGYVVNFYTIVNESEIESQLINIFKMAKSFKYDRELILKSFSLKSASSSKAESFDFTKENMPESGMLSEMVKQTDK